MDEKIFIVLPVHNRKEITEKFIHCLKAQTCQNYHLVLIDDGSTDGTEEMVREHLADLTVIKGRGNWWWAGSLQQGYLWLRDQEIHNEDVVLTMNDDTEFEPDFLEKGLNILHYHKDSLLLAQCYSKTTDALLDKGVHADWSRLSFVQAEKPENVNCLSTTGLFIRARDFFTVGGFYPKLLPHFTSDFEFTMRAHRKGFKLMTDPSVKLWLREDTTWNRKMGTEPFFHFLRNLFSKKSPYNPLVWTFFIALSSPWRYKFTNWCRIWMGTGLILIRRVFKPVVLEGSTHFVGRERK